MPKFLVESISIFRIRNVIECESVEHAMDTVVSGEAEKEFSQLHLDQIISSVRQIDDKEYLRIFNEDNEYLSSWDDKQKFKLVHKVDYETK